MKIKKLGTVLLASSLLGGMTVTSITSTSQSVSANEVNTIQEKNQTSFSNKKESLEKLMNFYETDNNGQVFLNINNPELKTDLGFTDQELNEIQSLLQQAKPLKFDKNRIMPRGLVGLRMHLGPNVRGMGAVAGGGFAAGVAGFYLKELALTGPIQAGAVGAISASVGGVVGFAINQGLTSVNVGPDIPFVSAAMDVYVP